MIHDRCWRRPVEHSACVCGSALWRLLACRWALERRRSVWHFCCCILSLAVCYVQNTVHYSTCMYRCHCRTASGKHGQLVETCAQLCKLGLNPDVPCCPVTSRLDPIRSGQTHTHTHSHPREPSARSSSRVRLRRGIACLLPSRSRAAQSTVPRSRHKRASRRQQDRGHFLASPRKHRNPPPAAPRSLPVTWPRGEWADFPATARFSAAVPCHPGAADSARF